jgi:hypothetical protein
MSVEVSSYRLERRGNVVGTHVLYTEIGSQTTLLEGNLSLSDNLGQSKVVQRSNCHTNRFFSYRFFETTQTGSDKRLYELVFDHLSGMVTAKRGENDRASIPYLLPYRDPLSVLFEVRNWHRSDGNPKRIPLLGKELTVIPNGIKNLQTLSGAKTAWAYTLHPGGSHVYVDTEEPHVILHLTQRLAGFNIEASLLKVEEEARMPANQPTQTHRSRGVKRRRKRHRKPRK